MSEPGVVDFTNTATKPTKKRKSSENAKKKPASEPKKKKQKVPVVEAEGPTEGFSAALNTILSKEVEEDKVDKEKEEEKERAKQAKVLTHERRLLRNKDHRVLTRENEEYSKEQALKKVATSGVVQLFNAVSNFQKTQEMTKKKNPSGLTKNKFLELLGSQSAPTKTTDSTTTTPKITETEKKAPKAKQAPKESVKWGVLSDDYMLNAKMNDWKNESDEDMNEYEEVEIEREMEEESE